MQVTFKKPTLKAVECSFNQGQANEFSDMQPFRTDGTVNETINKNHQEEKNVPVTTSYG